MSEKFNRRHSDAGFNARLDALEDRQPEVNELIELKDDIKALVDLLKQVRSAFSVFVAMGNALKWIVTLAATISALYFLLVKRDFASFTTIISKADQ